MMLQFKNPADFLQKKVKQWCGTYSTIVLQKYEYFATAGQLKILHYLNICSDVKMN